VRGRRGLLVLVMTGAAVAACSPQMSERAADELAGHAAAVRSATGSGSRAVADAALSELRAMVADLSASGELEEGKAAEILAAATRVGAALDVMPTTTTTTQPDEDEDDHGNGKGKGKGHDED